MTRSRIRQVYHLLLARHGPQHWWPGETPFEVMVGAVLTQNAAWANVERAIANLKATGLLEPEGMLACGPEVLAGALRPSGYFNVKARRLRALCAWILEQGGVVALDTWPTARLRSGLLGVHGVGPETADDILLYAFGRPVFVIDAYTRRLFARLECIDGEEPYERLRALFEQSLNANTEVYNEYHALIVRHAKDICRPRPRCRQCTLVHQCPAGRAYWVADSGTIPEATRSAEGGSP